MSESNWPKAILFDLDGTLIDSAPDIAGATNELLRAHAIDELSLDDIRRMIGNGVRTLVQRAFAHQGRTLGETELDLLFTQMMGIYGKHLINLTQPYDGVEGLLKEYSARGVKMAIVTNKPEGFTHTILKHLGWAPMFGAVVGGDTLKTRKPDPEMLFHACAQLGVEAKDAVMVGDSAADINAASNGKIANIVVRGGYTRIPVEELGAQAIIDRLADLDKAINALKSS